MLLCGSFVGPLRYLVIPKIRSCSTRPFPWEGESRPLSSTVFSRVGSSAPQDAVARSYAPVIGMRPSSPRLRRHISRLPKPNCCKVINSQKTVQFFLARPVHMTATSDWPSGYCQSIQLFFYGPWCGRHQSNLNTVHAVRWTVKMWDTSAEPKVHAYWYDGITKVRITVSGCNIRLAVSIATVINSWVCPSHFCVASHNLLVFTHCHTRMPASNPYPAVHCIPIRNEFISDNDNIDYVIR